MRSRRNQTPRHPQAKARNPQGPAARRGGTPRPPCRHPRIAVEAAGGGGALNENHAVEKAGWYLPEATIRREADAAPDNVRILRAKSESMERAVNEGNRLIVDAARPTPATGEMAALWDGKGLVVKRVETLPNAESPAIRLLSANLAYKPYICLADEAHIVGTVLRIVWRV